MADIKAVIFDLDDTLYPERAYTFSGYRAVADMFADRLDAPFELAERMQALFDTPARARVFNVILEEVRPDEAAAFLPAMIDCFRNHQPTIELDREADAALNRLADLYKLGIISDGYLAGQQAKIEALNLRSRVDAIILTDQWGQAFWKPHTRAFEAIAAALAVSHDACVYVGDNLAKDYVAPSALGWRTVHLVRPGGVHHGNQAPTGGVPDVTIESLDQLDDALIK